MVREYCSMYGSAPSINHPPCTGIQLLYRALLFLYISLGCTKRLSFVYLIFFLYKYSPRLFSRAKELKIISVYINQAKKNYKNRSPFSFFSLGSSFLLFPSSHNPPGKWSTIYYAQRSRSAFLQREVGSGSKTPQSWVNVLLQTKNGWNVTLSTFWWIYWAAYVIFWMYWNETLPDVLTSCTTCRPPPRRWPASDSYSTRYIVLFFSKVLPSGFYCFFFII